MITHTKFKAVEVEFKKRRGEVKKINKKIEISAFHTVPEVRNKSVRAPWRLNISHCYPSQLICEKERKKGRKKQKKRKKESKKERKKERCGNINENKYKSNIG